MPWVKLGDEFADAATELTDAEFRTHVEALGFSNRLLLDLVVAKRALRRFASTDEPESAAAGCVAKGWWEDRGEAWFIGLRWPEWQRDREQVETQRRKWSHDKLRRRAHARGDHSKCGSNNCKEARPLVDAPPDSEVESTTTDVSVSVSGRDRPLREVPTYVVGACEICEHDGELDGTGLCRGCAEQVSA